MAETLDTYLSTPITGGAALTALQFLASLESACIAQPNTNLTPQMGFKLDDTQVLALHATNVKFEGLMSYSYDGSTFYGLNIDSVTPLLINALVEVNAALNALNADYQAYKTAHP